MLFEAPVASSTLLKVLLNPASPSACSIACTGNHTALQLVHHDIQCMPAAVLARTSAGSRSALQVVHHDMQCIFTRSNVPSQGRAINVAGVYVSASGHWGMPCVLGQSRLNTNAMDACSSPTTAQSCTSCRHITAYVNPQVAMWSGGIEEDLFTCVNCLPSSSRRSACLLDSSARAARTRAVSVARLTVAYTNSIHHQIMLP